MGFSLVMTTTGSKKEAGKIGEFLVKSRLAACVNIINGIDSLFYWKGKLCREKEHLLLIKSVDGQNRKIVNVIKMLHGYETPEIVRIKIAGGERRYLEWLGNSTKKQ